MVNRDRLAQIGSLVLVVLAWWLISEAVQAFRVVQVRPGAPNLLPTPMDVVPPLTQLLGTGQFLTPLWESITRTAIGFASGFLSGVALGIATAKVRAFSITFAPLLNVILFAPTLVIIFLGIVMLGTQITAVAVITALVVAPNVAIYMRDVMHDFDNELVDMADSFQAGSWQRIKDMYLPYLVPPMLASARIGFSMSWKVVLLTEVFGFPGGLGFQIRMNYTIFNLPLLMAWLIIFVIALLVIEQFIRFTEHRVVKWQT
jgi:ABC-type nitrate/sulfonate/bicarbonate transport system permease component